MELEIKEFYKSCFESLIFYIFKFNNLDIDKLFFKDILYFEENTQFPLNVQMNSEPIMNLEQFFGMYGYQIIEHADLKIIGKNRYYIIPIDRFGWEHKSNSKFYDRIHHVHYLCVYNYDTTKLYYFDADVVEGIRYGSIGYKELGKIYEMYQCNYNVYNVLEIVRNTNYHNTISKDYMRKYYEVYCKFEKKVNKGYECFIYQSDYIFETINNAQNYFVIADQFLKYIQYSKVLEYQYQKLCGQGEGMFAVHEEFQLVQSLYLKNMMSREKVKEAEEKIKRHIISIGNRMRDAEAKKKELLVEYLEVL